MMAAAAAGQRGLRVVLVDHAERLAEKIRISGGGRCNFTNIGAGPANFISRNPNFCRSALAGYTPRDFLDLVERHGIAWHEKHKGQLFCDESSEDIIAMLRAECGDGRVQWRMPCTVRAIYRQTSGGAGIPEDDLFALETSTGEIVAHQLVLATGGMAIPQLGATDFALGIARQFGLKVIEPRPALVPLTFDAESWKPFAALSGVALEAQVATPSDVGRKGTMAFLEDLLFTHRGLSGPAILQISSYWDPSRPLTLNLAPGQDLEQALLAAKPGNRQHLATVLAGLMPKRLADAWLENAATLVSSGPAGTTSPSTSSSTHAVSARAAAQPLATLAEMRLADVPDKILRRLAHDIHGWTLVPSGTAGYKKAEVMRGGVDTRCLNQKTMEARDIPGLYFIGEAVDVTGWLGGYNFQWAWASGTACGRALKPY